MVMEFAMTIWLFVPQECILIIEIMLIMVQWAGA